MNAGERTGAAKLEWVVIVDEALSPGQAVNAAVCVAAATTPGIPGRLGRGSPDASDRWHPGLPWAGCSILAASSAQITAIRQQAIDRQLLAADMPASAQATRVYDDYLRELAKTGPGDLAPLAVSLIGPRNQVAKLVRRARGTGRSLGCGSGGARRRRRGAGLRSRPPGGCSSAVRPLPGRGR